MTQPILLPELQAGDQPVRVSTWLTALGEEVVVGDPVVELLIKGMTFDVEAPASGTLRRINHFEHDDVATGSILGWIETATANDESRPAFDQEMNSSESAR